MVFSAELIGPSFAPECALRGATGDDDEIPARVTAMEGSAALNKTPTVTPEERRDRKLRARIWKDFRKTYLFSQKMLADSTGISRRTIQQIEAGTITPRASTLSIFLHFKKKHQKSGARIFK